MNQQFQSEALVWIHSRTGLTVGPSDDLFATGILDSLSFSELVAHLEEVFNQEADFGSVLDWRDLVSVNAIVSLFADQS